MARQSKGLDYQFKVRMKDVERYAVEEVQKDYPGLSFNDAIRICIRRGFHQARPSYAVDAPVVDPTARDFTRPGPQDDADHIDGQTRIPDTMFSDKETN